MSAITTSSLSLKEIKNKIIGIEIEDKNSIAKPVPDAITALIGQIPLAYAAESSDEGYQIEINEILKYLMRAKLEGAVDQLLAFEVACNLNLFSTLAYIFTASRATTMLPAMIFKVVQFYLSHRIPAVADTHQIQRAFEYAIRQDQPELAGLLLDAFTSIETPLSGFTPSELAVRHGSFEVLQVLHAKDKSSLVKYMYNPILLTALKAFKVKDDKGREKLSTMFQWLLALEDPKLDPNQFSRVGKGINPAIYAASRGLEAEFTLLIKHGAEVSSFDFLFRNRQYVEDMTPAGWHLLLKLLVQEKYKPDFSDPPIMKHACEGSVDSIKALSTELIESQDVRQAIVVAIVKGHDLEVIQALFQKAAFSTSNMFELSTGEGYLILHWAVMFKRADVISLMTTEQLIAAEKVMVSQWCRTEMPFGWFSHSESTNFGVGSPLQWAIRMGNSEIYNVYKAKGVASGEHANFSPVWEAVKYEQSEMLSLILKGRSDDEKTSIFYEGLRGDFGDGRTTKYLASETILEHSESCALSLLDAFFKAGFNPNTYFTKARQERGPTLLEQAVQKGYWHAVRIICQEQAKPIVDYHGNSYVPAFCRNDNEVIVNLCAKGLAYAQLVVSSFKSLCRDFNDFNNFSRICHKLINTVDTETLKYMLDNGLTFYRKVTIPPEQMPEGELYDPEKFRVLSIVCHEVRFVDIPKKLESYQEAVRHKLNNKPQQNLVGELLKKRQLRPESGQDVLSLHADTPINPNGDFAKLLMQLFNQMNIGINGYHATLLTQDDISAFKIIKDFETLFNIPKLPKKEWNLPGIRSCYQSSGVASGAASGVCGALLLREAAAVRDPGGVSESKTPCE